MTDELTRLLSRVAITESGCWEWQGALTGAGYGAQQFRGRQELVHRISYLLHVGPIDGVILDHVCHSRDASCTAGSACPHRRCVNPAHLEPVSQQENVARGKTHVTQCPSGHPYDEANTYRWAGNGGRACRKCRNERSEANRRRRRALAKSKQKGN